MFIYNTIAGILRIFKPTSKFFSYKVQPSHKRTPDGDALRFYSQLHGFVSPPGRNSKERKKEKKHDNDREKDDRQSDKRSEEQKSVEFIPGEKSP